VVRGEDGEGSVGKANPDGFVVVGRITRWWRADTFGALEVWFVKVRSGQEEILWARFGVDGEASCLGRPQVGCCTGGGDMDDQPVMEC
jgi:hypothetical protein